MHGRWVSDAQFDRNHSLTVRTDGRWVCRRHTWQNSDTCDDCYDAWHPACHNMTRCVTPRVTTWRGVSHHVAQRVSNTCRHTTAGWELAEVMWSAQLEQSGGVQPAACCCRHTPVILSNRHRYWFIVREWSTEQVKCSLMSELTLNLQKYLQSSTSITQKLHIISVSWQIGLQSGRHLHQHSSGGIESII